MIEIYFFYKILGIQFRTSSKNLRVGLMRLQCINHLKSCKWVVAELGNFLRWFGSIRFKICFLLITKKLNIQWMNEMENHHEQTLVI